MCRTPTFGGNSELGLDGKLTRSSRGTLPNSIAKQCAVARKRFATATRGGNRDAPGSRGTRSDELRHGAATWSNISAHPHAIARTTPTTVPGGGVKGPKGTQSSQFAEQSILGHRRPQLHGQEPQQRIVAVEKKPKNGTELLQPNCVRAHTAEQSKAGRVLGSNAGRSCFIGVLQRFRLSRRPWETVIGETLTNCYIRYFGAHSRGLIFPFRNQAVCTQCVLHLDNGSLSHPERQLMNRKIIQALLSARVVENVAQWGLVKMAEIPVMCVDIRPFRQELAIINEVDESAQSLEMWRCRSEQFGFAEKVDDHVQVLLGRQTRAQLEISVRTLLPSFILDRDAYMAS